MIRVEDMSDEELLAATQGCTEFTCIYHSAFNQELRRRDREGNE